MSVVGRKGRICVAVVVAANLVAFAVTFVVTGGASSVMTGLRGGMGVEQNSIGAEAAPPPHHREPFPKSLHDLGEAKEVIADPGAAGREDMVPIFFEVPGSGGSAAREYWATCHGKVEAGFGTDYGGTANKGQVSSSLSLSLSSFFSERKKGGREKNEKKAGISKPEIEPGPGPGPGPGSGPSASPPKMGENFRSHAPSPPGCPSPARRRRRASRRTPDDMPLSEALREGCRGGGQGRR